MSDQDSIEEAETAAETAFGEIQEPEEKEEPTEEKEAETAAETAFGDVARDEEEQITPEKGTPENPIVIETGPELETSPGGDDDGGGGTTAEPETTPEPEKTTTKEEKQQTQETKTETAEPATQPQLDRVFKEKPFGTPKELTEKQIESLQEARGPIQQDITPETEEILQTQKQIIQSRERVEEAKQALEEAPANTKFIDPETGETITREEAREKLEKSEAKIEEAQTEVSKAFQEVEQRVQRPETDVVQRLKEAETRGPVDELGRQLTLRGTQLQQTAEQTAEDITSFITRERDITIPLTDQEVRFDPTTTVLPLAEERRIEEQIRQNLLTEQQKEKAISPVKTIQEETITGGLTLGTQLTGLAGQAGGGIIRTGVVAREEGLQEASEIPISGIGRFATSTGRQLKQQPTQFISRETGEEVGEIAAGTVLLGPIGAAAGGFPTPEITPKSLTTTKRFATGELKFRAREPDVIGQTEDIQAIRREFVEPEEGEGRIQVVQGFTEEGLTTGEAQILGTRLETPLTRREFLKERLQQTRQELADFIEIDTRKGGLFIPKRTEPETTPETEETVNIEEESDLFIETEPEPETTPGTRTNLRPKTVEDIPEEKQQKRQEPENIPEEAQKPEIFPTLEQEVEPVQTVETIEEIQPETTIPERKVQIETTLGIETRPERTPEIIPETEAEGTQTIQIEETEAERETGFAPSIDAIITGKTITREEARETGLTEQEFTGIETRPQIIPGTETEEEEQEDFEKLFGF